MRLWEIFNPDTKKKTFLQPNLLKEVDEPDDVRSLRCSYFSGVNAGAENALGPLGTSRKFLAAVFCCCSPGGANGNSRKILLLQPGNYTTQKHFGIKLIGKQSTGMFFELLVNIFLKMRG